jgi:ADP-heptose:LPS heptosyltransferase
MERVVQQPLPCTPCLKSRCVWPQPMECLTAISPATVFQSIQRELQRPG